MIVLTGVKAPFELTQYAIAIKQQGIDFVIRHYSHQSGKSLSLAEARALTDAGLQIGVLWEGPALQLGYYSRAQGCADGAAAYLMAQSVIGQPTGSVIYFAVPDAAAVDGTAVRYFEGVSQAFGAAAPDERQYQVGVCAGAAVCADLLARGLAALSWLADDSDQAYDGYSLRQQGGALLPVDDGQRISVGMLCNSAQRPAGLFRVL